MKTRALALTFLTLFTAGALGAQAYNYPALQTPRIVDREYNFAAAAGGDAGTSLVFQWREGLSADWQLTLEGGLAAPKSPPPPFPKLDTRLLVGVGVAYQWVRATADLPLDIAVTGEVGLWSGNGLTAFQIPVGVAAGHTFKFDNGTELTPFVHPRLSLDNPNCNGCGGSKLDVNIDVGVNYGITQQLAVRLAALLGGASYAGSTNAIGFSLAWTPKGLKKF
ncbi:MAG: hypothetical protein ACHQSE_08890 [Gemmatimonadales bacterium]